MNTTTFNTNTMKYYFLIASFMVLHATIFAQAPSIVSSSGTIPSEFLSPSSEKYAKKIEAYQRTEKDNSRTSKNKKEFYLESSYGIDELLKGGYVLFNDELGAYVNEVLAKLPLSKELIKNKNPRIYIVKSNEVNAFATEQGIIFVTIGLLANIESEAQLAFILAHEISHIEEDHGLDKFLTYTNKNEQWLKNLKNSGDIFSESIYSQKLESEADSLGLELFLDSKYDHTEVEDVFTTLYYSYLSYSEASFDRSFFDDENYILPNKVWLDTVNAIQPMEDGNKDSTHPASASRMESVKGKTQNIDRTGKDVFLLEKNRFEQIQEISRYQLPFLCLDNGDNARAIYNAFILLKQYPDNLELKKLIAKALYMEAKYQQANEEDEENSKKSLYYHVKKMEGALHRLGYLFKEMSYDEFNILALKYNYEVWLEDKEDQQLDMAVQSLVNNLAKSFDNLDKFKSTARPKQVDTELVDVKSDSTNVEKKELTRDEKISKANKKKEDKEKEASYIEYAFVDYVETEDFKNRFQIAKDNIALYEENYEEEKETNFFSYNDAVKDAASLGIKKIVVVNPQYLSIKNSVQYLKSEKKRFHFHEQIKDLAAKNNLDLTLLDVAQLDAKDSKSFKEISQLETYFQQQLSFPSSGLHASSNQNIVNDIAEEHGTEYFLWTGLITVDDPSLNIYGNFVGLLFPPYIAFSLFDRSIYRAETFYYAILFDVKTGKRRALKLDSVQGALSDKMLNAHIYDAFNQIVR